MSIFPIINLYPLDALIQMGASFEAKDIYISKRTYDIYEGTLYFHELHVPVLVKKTRDNLSFVILSEPLLGIQRELLQKYATSYELIPISLHFTNARNFLIKLLSIGGFLFCISQLLRSMLNPLFNTYTPLLLVGTIIASFLMKMAHRHFRRYV